MKKAFVLVFLVFLQSAVALPNSYFADAGNFSRSQGFNLWFEGAKLPESANWVVNPTGVGENDPAPFMGSDYLVFDSGEKTLSSYFLGATKQLSFGKDSVFLAWVYVVENPEYLTVGLHSPSSGWRFVSFGSQSETDSRKRVSLKLPKEGSWQVLVLRSEDFFSDKNEGSVDGFGVELFGGKVLVDSLAVIKSDIIETGNLPQLSMEISGENFSKGENIDINGLSSEEVLVNAFSGNKKIFSVALSPAPDKRFSFSYSIKPNDLQGEWLIVASTSFNELSKKIMVSASAKSEQLKISFLSPFSNTFDKNSMIPISVRVERQGLPVGNARVSLWGFLGERIELKKNESGAFILDYVVPERVEEGRNNILVAAGLLDYNNSSGEASLPLIVRARSVIIELLEPKIKEFNFGNPLSIKVRASYPDGSPANVDSLQVEFSMPVENKYVFDLNSTGPGIFSGRFSTGFFSDNPLSIKVISYSRIEEKKETVFQLKSNAYWFNFAKSNILFFAFPLIIILIAIVVWLSEVKSRLGESDLLKEKEALEKKLRKLEKGYYGGELFNEGDFNAKKLSLETRLNRVNVALREIKKKN